MFWKSRHKLETELERLRKENVVLQRQLAEEKNRYSELFVDAANSVRDLWLEIRQLRAKLGLPIRERK